MQKNPDINVLLGPLAREVPTNVVPPTKIRKRPSIIHIREHTPEATYKDGYVSPSEDEDRLVKWIGQYKALSKSRPAVPLEMPAAPVIPVRETPKRVVPSDIHVRFTEAMATQGEPPIDKKQFILLMADFLTGPRIGFDAWYLGKASEAGRPVDERMGFLKELLNTYLHRVMHNKPEGMPVVERGNIRRIISFWEKMGFTGMDKLGISFPKVKTGLDS